MTPCLSSRRVRSGVSGGRWVVPQTGWIICSIGRGVKFGGAAAGLIASCALVMASTLTAAAQSSQQLAVDATRVIEALAIRPGSIVAEIGAETAS
jgi:hypothetical protein